MKITVVVQFSSVTQSIVFAHSYNIRTLLVQLKIKLASVTKKIARNLIVKNKINCKKILAINQQINH